MELISSIFNWLLSALVNIILFGTLFGFIIHTIWNLWSNWGSPKHNE